MTREEMAQFLDEINTALTSNVGGELPILETSTKIIEHYNRGKMEAFHEPGYFIFHGVKVCEKGKTKEILAKDGLTMEQKNFGGNK